MMSKLTNFLFGNIPFSCVSIYSLEESIEKLSEETKRSVFQSLTKQNAVGIVTESNVRLQRVIPMFGNSFKPIFVGQFNTKSGKVEIEGKFTTFAISKVFMVFWLGFAAFWTVGATIKTYDTWISNPERFDVEPILMFFPLIGLAFFVVGIVFFKGCWRLSIRDIDYLKNVITKALS